MDENNQVVSPIDIIGETLEKVKKIKESRKIENLRIQTNLIVPLCEALSTTLEQIGVLSEQVSAIVRDFGGKIGYDGEEIIGTDEKLDDIVTTEVPKRGRKAKNTEKIDDQAPKTDSDPVL